MRLLTPLAAALALTITSTVMVTDPAQAQLMPDSSGPIDITGNTLEVVDNIATWTGNVRAIQGDAILTAKRLVAHLDDGGNFKTITVYDDVRYSNGKEAITGEEGVYDAGERTITVLRNVVATQGKQVMTGGALVYWIDTGKIRFTSPGGSRIRGIFHTKEETNQS